LRTPLSISAPSWRKFSNIFRASRARSRAASRSAAASACCISQPPTFADLDDAGAFDLIKPLLRFYVSAASPQCQAVNASIGFTFLLRKPSQIDINSGKLLAQLFG
jgi:hypothetical protein